MPAGDDGEAGEGDDIQPDVENVYGGAGGDHLIGSAANNRITGLWGDDYIEGNAGNDTLLGRAGADALLGGPATTASTPRTARRTGSTVARAATGWSSANPFD